MIKLVSWDVDGTLFSYTRLFTTLLRLSPAKLRTTGWARTFKQIRDICQFHRQLESQRRSPGCRVDFVTLGQFGPVREREKEALAAALAMMEPRDSVRHWLRECEAAGVVQVALSDFESDYKLEALGIRGYFAATYSSCATGFWKPSPVAFDRVQRDFGILPGEHLHIGDRHDSDGAACLSNGCHFVHVRDLPLVTVP